MDAPLSKWREIRKYFIEFRFTQFIVGDLSFILKLASFIRPATKMCIAASILMHAAAASIPG